LLSAHYRHPLDLTEEALHESRSAVGRINDGLDTAAKLLALKGAVTAAAAPTDETRALRARFEEVMDDDFNMPRALAVLFDIVNLIHEARQATPPQLDRLAALVALGRELRDFFDLQATDAPQAPEGDLTGQLVELLILARQEARKAKVFAIADLIRDRLADLGIALEDHPQGTIWKRKGD
jgi:cysteinyl-tRNA synthetase